MTILNLLFIVFLGILFFIAYFHISNYLLDSYGGKSVKRYNFENSIRVIVFIAPAFIGTLKSALNRTLFPSML